MGKLFGGIVIVFIDCEILFSVPFADLAATYSPVS